jgi:hypothetical protein
LVEPRIINYNLFSGFKTEREFLMPIMTFPDELAGVWDRATHGTVNAAEIANFLNPKFSAYVESKYGKNEANEIVDSIKIRSDDFFNLVFDDRQKMTDAGDFSFATKAPPAPHKTTSGNKTCFEMVKLFLALP